MRRSATGPCLSGVRRVEESAADPDDRQRNGFNVVEQEQEEESTQLQDQRFSSSNQTRPRVPSVFQQERFGVTWELEGNVNGDSFRVFGSGSADTRSGENVLDLTAAPTFPCGFDPAASHLICNLALGGFAAAGPEDLALRRLVDYELRISPQRIARIFNLAGEEIARLEAITTLRVSDGAVAVTNKLMGFCRIPGAVVDVWGYESLEPAGPRRATGVAHFGLRLDHGQRLNGTTIIPYFFDKGDLKAPIHRSVDKMKCKRLSDTMVQLTSASKWSTLTTGMQAH